MSNNVRRVSDSYRTILIHQYYSVNDKQCQKSVRQASNSYRTILIHQYYSVNDKQCQKSVKQYQTMLNNVNTVAKYK